MIQFNLLPDIKLEYIKARRTKQLVVMTATILAGASLAIAVMLFFGVNVLQKRHLAHLDRDIKESSEKLRSEPELNKILTVQNQLNSISGLHDQKPAAERLGRYLSQVTPNEVSISKLEVDFTQNIITFDGGAASLKAVNQFVDTLKFTDYRVGEDNNGKAFSEVVLTSFSREDAERQDGNPATYKITLKYNPVIFSTTEAASLQVPNTVTTRSSTERPTELFQQREEQNE